MAHVWHNIFFHQKEQLLHTAGCSNPKAELWHMCGIHHKAEVPRDILTQLLLDLLLTGPDHAWPIDKKHLIQMIRYCVSKTDNSHWRQETWHRSSTLVQAS